MQGRTAIFHCQIAICTRLQKHFCALFTASFLNTCGYVKRRLADITTLKSLEFHVKKCLFCMSMTLENDRLQNPCIEFNDLQKRLFFKINLERKKRKWIDFLHLYHVCGLPNLLYRERYPKEEGSKNCEAKDLHHARREIQRRKEAVKSNYLEYGL